MPELPQIENADTVVPIAIICGCVLLMALVWLLTRKSYAKTRTEAQAKARVVGQTEATAAQIGAWHRAHGTTVKRWINNHEDVLARVSNDGLAINLSSDLTANHELLGPRIDEAITTHPAARLRAQLSSLVQASRATIDSLRRSNWAQAEAEHLVYLEHRDEWLERIRKFEALEAAPVAEVETPDEVSDVASWLDRNDQSVG